MEWKKIEGYDYDYHVNCTGDIVNFTLGNTLTPSDNGLGYLSVELKKNSKGVRQYVHRLVASAFIPNPRNLPQVNHIDRNKANNSVSNLEWCTARGNSHHCKSWEFAISSTRKPVLQFDENGNLLREYISVNDCARRLNISESQISRCCNGKFKQTHGCIFRYKELVEYE